MKSRTKSKYLPGVSGNYVQTPRDAPLFLTPIRESLPTNTYGIKFQLDGHKPQELQLEFVAKQRTKKSAMSVYKFSVKIDGKNIFSWTLPAIKRYKPKFLNTL